MNRENPRTNGKSQPIQTKITQRSKYILLSGFLNGDGRNKRGKMTLKIERELRESNCEETMEGLWLLSDSVRQRGGLDTAPWSSASISTFFYAPPWITGAGKA